MIFQRYLSFCFLIRVMINIYCYWFSVLKKFWTSIDLILTSKHKKTHKYTFVTNFKRKLLRWKMNHKNWLFHFVALNTKMQEMSISLHNITAIKYGCPRSKLRVKNKKMYRQNTRSKHYTYNRRKEFVSKIYMSRNGFSMTKYQLINNVKILIYNLNRENPFIEVTNLIVIRIRLFYVIDIWI